MYHVGIVYEDVIREVYGPYSWDEAMRVGKFFVDRLGGDVEDLEIDSLGIAYVDDIVVQIFVSEPAKF